MYGCNKRKSMGVESPECFNFKPTENTNERHVFENLCLDTSLCGFSYDPTLLVDLNKVSSFDEACIRLTTKCVSIVRQLCSVGHNVTDFAVTSVVTSTKTTLVPESPVSLFSSQLLPSSVYFLDSTNLDEPNSNGFDCMNNDTLTPRDNINIQVMSELWGRLKNKNYTGMVAVACVTDSSVPNGRIKDCYSIKALADTLLSDIKEYFISEKNYSTFDKDFDNSGALNTGKSSNSEPGEEYLLCVVYRSKEAYKDIKNASLKQKATEADTCSWKRRKIQYP